MTHVAPVPQRVGSGLESAQVQRRLALLRRQQPLAYHDVAAGEPRYLSTYKLLHSHQHGRGGDDYSGGGESDEKQNDDTTAAPSASTNAIDRARRLPFWETNYSRATAFARDYDAWVRSQGQRVGTAQPNGYIRNHLGAVVERKESPEQVNDRFMILSHQQFRPSTFGVLPDPRTVNHNAPRQSAYTKEHITPDGVAGDASMTVIDESLIHPTVRKAARVIDPPDHKNYGATFNSFHPLRV